MVEGSWPRMMIKEPIGNTQFVGGHILAEDTTRTGYSVLRANRTPPQKLFCGSGTCCQKLFASWCDPVDFSAPATFRLPYSLQVALLFHRMKKWVKCSSAQVDFESVTDL